MREERLVIQELLKYGQRSGLTNFQMWDNAKKGVEEFEFVYNVLVDKRNMFGVAKKGLSQQEVTLRIEQIQAVIQSAVDKGYLDVKSKAGLIERGIWPTSSGRDFIKPQNFLLATLGKWSPITTILISVLGGMIGTFILTFLRWLLSLRGLQ